MRIYLAGDVRDHEQFKQYAGDLEGQGHEVASTWHQDGYLADVISRCDELRSARTESTMSFMAAVMKGDDPPKPNLNRVVNPLLGPESDEALKKCKDELDSADLVIAFIGAGSFEAGYAIATGKPLITVGEFDSPFYHYFQSEFDSADGWLHALSKVSRFRPIRLRGMESAESDS
ncbi:MAG TPA: hypothetical protein VEB03_00895 [Candidatus Nanoarchaeia archaeon]|nr:hypothetical protein [Candidatus Nanoarchaeia archaeon]